MDRSTFNYGLASGRNTHEPHLFKDSIQIPRSKEIAPEIDRRLFALKDKKLDWTLNAKLSHGKSPTTFGVRNSTETKAGSVVSISQRQTGLDIEPTDSSISFDTLWNWGPDPTLLAPEEGPVHVSDRIADTVKLPEKAKTRSNRQGRRTYRGFVTQKARRERPWSTKKHGSKKSTNSGTSQTKNFFTKHFQTSLAWQAEIDAHVKKTSNDANAIEFKMNAINAMSKKITDFDDEYQMSQNDHEPASINAAGKKYHVRRNEEHHILRCRRRLFRLDRLYMCYTISQDNTTMSESRKRERFLALKNRTVSLRIDDMVKRGGRHGGAPLAPNRSSWQLQELLLHEKLGSDARITD